jgi:hypothetical protein
MSSKLNNLWIKITRKHRKLGEVSPCPCSEASEENCEDCQDLPRGYFRDCRIAEGFYEVVESQIA